MPRSSFESHISSLARLEVRSLKPCVHGGEIVEAAERLGSGSLLDFSTNTNPLGASPKVYKEIGKDSLRISSYPETNSVRLRKAIAEHFRAHLSFRNVIVGNGSTELIHLFAYVFLGKGDVCIIPYPTFGEYEPAAVKAGAKIVFVKLNRGFSIDPEKILRVKDAKTAFLCNPNNPTGSVFPREALLKIVGEAYRRGTLVLLDECDMEFVEGNGNFSLVNFVGKYPNLFVLKSFTKAHGLAALRIGYGFAHASMINLLLKVKIPWNVSSVAQAAAIAALKDEKHLQKAQQLISREKPILQNKIRSLDGLRVYPSETNYFLVNIKGVGLTAKRLKEKMLRHGVLIRDCASFRGMGRYFIRAAVRSQDENEKFLEALRKALAENRSERGLEEALRKGKLAGSDCSCEYYPCHFEGQDCTFCFCPFYPCEDDSIGGKLIRSSNGQLVWDCSGCVRMHQTPVARRVLHEISSLNNKHSRIRLRTIREKLRGDPHG